MSVQETKGYQWLSNMTPEQGAAWKEEVQAFVDGGGDLSMDMQHSGRW